MSDIFADNFPEMLEEICKATPQARQELTRLGIDSDCLCPNPEPKLKVTTPNKTISFRKRHPLAKTPTRQKPGDVGFDLSATEEVTIYPAYSYTEELNGGEWVGDDWVENYDISVKGAHVTAVSTGISVEFPKGYYGKVVSRSGLAFTHGVIVLNAPGIIDEQFIGEIKVLLINLSSTPFYVRPGDRIAQLLVEKYESNLEFTEVQNIRQTERGENGLGSTGVK